MQDVSIKLNPGLS